MESTLLALLRCPGCQAGDLQDSEGGDGEPGLSCVACARRYPVPDGVIDLSLFEELDAATVREVEAQDRCAGDIYDNPETLAYHWDPLDTAELASALPRGARRILDVGSGLGLLGEMVHAEVVGVDLSMELLRRARTRLTAAVRADAARLPFRDGAFDALFVRGTLHHLVAHERPLAEMRRVLAPGGTALFSDPRAFAFMERVKGMVRSDSVYYAETHRAFTRDEYVELIGRHFDIERVRLRHGPGITLINALDAFFLGRLIPARKEIARFLHALDRPFGRAAGLRDLGLLIEVVARRPAD